MQPLVLSGFDFNLISAAVSCLTLFTQVFCIFLFLGAASLFGTIVSQINEIVASQTNISKELDCVLEAYFSIEPRHVTPDKVHACNCDSC